MVLNQHAAKPIISMIQRDSFPRFKASQLLARLDGSPEDFTPFYHSGRNTVGFKAFLAYTVGEFGEESQMWMVDFKKREDAYLKRKFGNLFKIALPKYFDADGKRRINLSSTHMDPIQQLYEAVCAGENYVEGIKPGLEAVRGCTCSGT